MRQPRPFGITLSALAVLALNVGPLGCGGGGDAATGPGDDGGNGPDGELRIVAVTPGDGATDAEPAGQVLARFNRAIDPATLTPSAFTLTRDGTALTTAASYDPASLSARLVAPLLPGTTYQAEVTTAVAGAAGDPLAAGKEWSFTTRTWDAVPVVPVRGEDISIVLDGTGRVHMTYRDPTVDGFAYASCAAGCADPGNWEETVLEPGGNTGFATSLQVEPGGRLHVVYTDFEQRNLKYATCAASCFGPANWTIVTIDQTRSRNNSLIRDATGRLHVTYTFTQVAQPSYLKYATCAADCTTPASWQATTADPEGAGLVAAALALDGSGRLHVSYVHRPLGAARGFLRYGTCADSCAEPANWTLTTVDGSGEVQPYTSIAAGPDGRIHVAFITQEPGRLRYAACLTECASPASWTAVPIDPGTVVLNDVFVRAGPDGRIHLVYSDDAAIDFKYATCVGCASAESWEFTTLASEGSVGTWSALLIDPAGGVHIAYQDGSNARVNYIQ